MSSLKPAQIMEKLKINMKELFEIANNTLTNSKEKSTDEIQKEINKRIKNMSEINHCEELAYSVMKRYFNLVSYFEENVFLFFSKYDVPDKSAIIYNIIDEYNIVINNLTEEENAFFKLFFINRNMKESLLKYSKDKGESVKFIYDILKELSLEKN